MKTLYLIFPILYSSVSFGMEEINYETNNSTLTTQTQKSYSGFYTSLSEQKLWKSSINNNTAILPQTVTLNSIEIISSCLSPSITQDSRIAIYEYTNGKLGSYVGISTNFIHFEKSLTEYTLSFSKITLDSTKTYGYFFVRNDQSMENLSNPNPILKETYLKLAITVLGDYVMATKNTDLTSLPSNSGTFTDRSLNKGKDTYMPVVTFNTSYNAIPEPSSTVLGTLSLMFTLLIRKRTD